ncbi:hypothetical protein NC651_010870 [Populus alba x Populus x berolinensis]|nr:hypothetical protein NC651_010870 [Populus alba x Populus x berolinensis]
MKKQILSESSQKSQIEEAFKILMVLLIQENLRTHIAYLLVSMGRRQGVAGSLQKFFFLASSLLSTQTVLFTR